MSNSIPASQSPVTGWKGQRSPMMNGWLVWLVISGFSTQQCSIIKTDHSFQGWRQKLSLRARAGRFPRIQTALGEILEESLRQRAGPSGGVTCCVTVSTRWPTVNDKRWSTAVRFHRPLPVSPPTNWSGNKGAGRANKQRRRLWAEPFSAWSRCALQGCDRCCSVHVNKDLKGNLMESHKHLEDGQTRRNSPCQCCYVAKILQM